MHNIADALFQNLFLPTIANSISQLVVFQPYNKLS